MPEPRRWNVLRQQTQYEEDIVSRCMRDFGQMQSRKVNTAQQCEEISRLIDPNSRNTFMFGSYNWPGQKKTQDQVDASGAVALDRFESICDSLLTPQNSTWHQLTADDDYVMKDRDTRLWFEQATRKLFKLRYAPTANFVGQQQNNWRTLGAYGTPCMLVDALDGALYGMRGLRYRSIPFGQLFIRENHQGIVDHVIRWFRIDARQAFQKWGEEVPEDIRKALDANNSAQFEFLHIVCPRQDFDPDAKLSVKGKPFASYYISLTGRRMMEEGGYRSFPYAISRFRQAPDEEYARSPAMMVLSSLKTLNAQKTVFLKQGHRAGDPVLLLADDGLVSSMNLRPGAMNPGTMTMDGKRLVDVLPSGDIQITEKMMDAERVIVEDVFFTSLFKLILDENIATATQVMEIVNQKGILIAPTMGRQQSELLGSMIDRELDVAASEGLLPPMPPRLREARGAYQVTYTGPLSRVQRTQEVLGFTRTVDFAKEVVGITGDVSIMDRFNFDTALPAIADIGFTPPSWMSSDEQVAQKARARAKAQQAEQQLKALPNIAAMKKADAAQFKAGMTGGQPPQGGA